MRFGKNQKFGLLTNDFFETDLRPVLRGIHDGNGAGMLQGVGDKGVFADGDERLGPDNEQDAARGERGDALLRVGEAALAYLWRGPVPVSGAPSNSASARWRQ